MPVYFGKIRSCKDNFLFTDPVFGICSDFPKLPSLENGKNYIFVFSYYNHYLFLHQNHHIQGLIFVEMQINVFDDYYYFLNLSFYLK